VRALEPDVQGYVDRDGVKVAYESFGVPSPERPTVVFVPIDTLIHSRAWKAQVPFLARFAHVVTIDPRGNGRSDRPEDPSAYDFREFVGDTIAVMDALAVERAILVGVCVSAYQALLVAALHPDRVQGVVAFGPWALDGLAPFPEKADAIERFDEEREDEDGWAKRNRHYWLRDWRGYVEFFFGQLVPEPHSTKLVEDLVSFACDSTPEIQLLDYELDPWPPTVEESDALLSTITCPVMVIHGTADVCQLYSRGKRLAEVTGATLVTLEGSGHVPMGREPVKVNLLLRDFVHQVTGTSRPVMPWQRAMSRRPRALFLSSPIGLGHARRDLAIVRALRERRPDLDVAWLTQSPVTDFLQAHGEHVHPAARFLASESGHFQSQAGEHDLHAFQAVRSMDEILVANFMVFQDLVTDEHFDLWIGDEAWDVDHFLHENPELKRTPFAWLTDFVGWLPMPDGGPAEAALTADYNAEMVEHVARYPRLRDISVFVGNPDDIVAADLGPDLPSVRDWTESHFAFPGYVTGFDPAETADRTELRRRLGYAEDETVCVVAVGGSGVGEHLLRRVAGAHAAIASQVPDLRMVLVAGPRIDPASLPHGPGLEVHGYVHDLHHHLAACDIAVVQGGLTTTMELVAAGRPFVYVPLRHHFEQNLHVAHRLDRHGAGHRLDWVDATPDAIAAAVVEELGRTPAYRPVETDGAARTADLLSALL
jgi:pimeloyl-ACP methyl ester carboxylesterase/predicted glycosyltransferase